MTDATPTDHPPRRVSPMVRTALVVGPVVACIGIAWTAIAPSNASSAAILVGLITAIAATHWFGRSGASADDD